VGTAAEKLLLACKSGEVEAVTRQLELALFMRVRGGFDLNSAR
jgi:hypothetical protein